MNSVALDSESVEAVAVRVAELLRGEAVGPELVDAAEIARRFNVSRDFIYEHASELGAIRLGETGEGKKPRLRFDPAIVADRLLPRPHPLTDPTLRPIKPKRRRTAPAELLPIRGRTAA